MATNLFPPNRGPYSPHPRHAPRAALDHPRAPYELHCDETHDDGALLRPNPTRRSRGESFTSATVMLASTSLR